MTREPIDEKTLQKEYEELCKKYKDNPAIIARLTMSYLQTLRHLLEKQELIKSLKESGWNL